MNGTALRILCGTFLILTLASATQAAPPPPSTQPANTRPSHPVSPQTTDRATWWVNAAADQVAQIPSAKLRTSYMYIVLKMQLCANPASDPDATLKAFQDLQNSTSPRVNLGHWYTDCAWTFFQNGNPDAYKRFDGLAEQEAARCKDQDDAYLIRTKIITQIAELEGIPSAIHAVEKIKSPRWRSEYYCDILNHLSQTSNHKPTTQQCDELLRRAEEDFHKTASSEDIERVRGNLAIALVSGGQLDKARQQIERLKVPSWRCRASGMLAAAYAKKHDAKEFQSALDLFKESADRSGEHQPGMYAAEAERLYDAHDERHWSDLLKESTEFVDKLDRKEARSWEMSIIAVAQAHCGRIDEALKTVKQISAQRDVDHAMEWIIWFECKQKQFATAEKQLNQMQYSRARQWVCYELFRCEAYEGASRHFGSGFSSSPPPWIR